MSQVIAPTPGRIVWYYPAPHDGLAQLDGQPLAAIVAGVHNNNSVNLAIFDAYGNTQQRSRVHLVQPNEDRPNNAHATWMPYQVGAAGIAPVVGETAVGTQVASTGDTTAAMFAETDGTSASETGLVNTQTADSNVTESNTQAPAGE